MKKPLILLVDDDELFLQTTRQQITELGFGVITAVKGSQADDEISSKEIDLVLLDLKLPDVDGITLFKRWQSSISSLSL